MSYMVILKDGEKIDCGESDAALASTLMNNHGNIQETYWSIEGNAS